MNILLHQTMVSELGIMSHNRSKNKTYLSGPLVLVANMQIKLLRQFQFLNFDGPLLLLCYAYLL